ncbi:hypothetical protein DFH09DRAFT_1458747 [Mycena vulgaris]|nr:hypothetical protein DFH09DRAFT_1458747 [Mycena vulgaris]
MPREPTVTDIQLTSIITCLTPLVPLLTELHDGFGTPFVQAISNTTLSLISVVQNVKRNKEECVQLMVNIYKLISAIINLHLQSKPVGSLSPAMLDSIGGFTQTLHKIHTFVEAQQDGNKIKQFFRQAEMNTLLKDCRAGLQQAVDVFKVMGAGPTILSDIKEMQKSTQDMQNELLELISMESDGINSDSSSSIYRGHRNSSDNFSMLPARPKIFHGRDSELADILNSLKQETVRIAILGGGGMGKTSLARAVLHHPHVVAKYELRLFVPCDSATTSSDLAVLLGSYIGLKPGRHLQRLVVDHFSRRTTSLLILDNLEASWDAMDSRRDVEEFLSLLTGVQHLALMITMRGAERPAKVRWTHPFLPPLQPLTDEAARQTFIDIADDFHNSNEITRVLQLTDNMPLAVDLIAHLVDYEGCANVLARWETEKTALFSQGYDRRSSLDASITMSLASPRITSRPGAKDLLSLLSILPDGLSDVQLVQSHLPIQDVLACKTALLGTGLAYNNSNRLKVLVPVREHIQLLHPPAAPLVKPLQDRFHSLLDLYQKYREGDQVVVNSDEITTNLGNLKQVFQRGLSAANPDLLHTIRCVIGLTSAFEMAGHGPLGLMDKIPAVLPRPCDCSLEIELITEMIRKYHPVVNPETLIAQGISLVNHINDPVLELRFYSAVGLHHRHRNPSSAMEFFEKALKLSRLCGATIDQSRALRNISGIKMLSGDYITASSYAREAQRLARLSGNLYEETRGLEFEAICTTYLGDYKESILLLRRSKTLGSLSGISGAALGDEITNSMASVYLLKSEYLEARSIHTEHVQKLPEQGFRHAMARFNIAEIDVYIGASTEVIHENLDKAEMLFTACEISFAVTWCKCTLAHLHLRDGDTAAAKALFLECLNSSWGRDGQTVSGSLERLGDVNRWRTEDYHWTSRWTVVYLAHSHRFQNRSAFHKALCFFGDVVLRQGDINTAHSLFTVALEGFTQMDVHRSRAQCMLRLGDLAKQRNDLVKAKALWKQAHPLFTRSLQAKEIVEVDNRLAALEEDVLAKDRQTLARLRNMEVPRTLFADTDIWMDEPSARTKVLDTEF